jgi:hypothetical protein
MNCSNEISTTIYRSYWYQSNFLWGFCGKLQDPRIGLRRKSPLAMEDGSNCNNPRDEIEERFSNLEEQVTDISYNMALLMATLANNLDLLGRLVALN